MKKLFSKKNFYLYCAFFILALFAYITYKTPLAGDDWGYALNGSLGTPIKSALEFYQTWSGRFFSELWGMLIPCRKYLWNIINPLLFFGIFICLYKLSYVKNKNILSCLLILAMMLSVDDNLRMETYSWIMGTTYIIPLFFSLLYFVLVDKMMRTSLYDIKFKVCLYLVNILLFIIGLMMENIAATMIVGEVVLIIYAYFNKKQALKYLIINLAFSVVSFAILRCSPGSNARLLSEHATWNSMSLFEKISSAYPNFLSISFINNNYAISLFSLCLILLIIFTHKEVKTIYKVLNIIVLALGIVTVFSFVLGDSFLNSNSSIYSYIFWPIYIINAFVVLFVYTVGEYRANKVVYLLMIAGCNALVMLYSPIYGSRSAIYTVYYLIVVSTIIFDSININKHLVNIGLFIVLVLVVGDRTHEYLYKYRLVGLKQQERLEIIKYYQGHPEVKEAWIPRFPVYSIHGGDIEEGDTYHFETFKEYFRLPQSADKIIFYYEDSDTN